MFSLLFLVAVVIAFIICYAPFHVQRLITSRLNVSHLTLIQQRGITIFFFISGIFYYIGSTVNPIFYHLFSRKYRLACMRTMQRIVHCKRHAHRRYRPNRKNIPKEDKPPLVTPLSNQIRTVRLAGRTSHSPNPTKANGHQEKNVNYFTHLSLAAYTPD